MSLYEKLLIRKNSGEKIDFSKITYDDLRQLFYSESITDNQIAELYGISPSKVKYKRTKMKITYKAIIKEKILLGDEEVFKVMNVKSMEKLMKYENIDKLAKATTHFAFRNGPIENIHSYGNIDDEEMKILNKFMVNRLAYIWSLIIQNKWFELEYLIDSYDRDYGQDWDKADIDDGGNVELLNN